MINTILSEHFKDISNHFQFVTEEKDQAESVHQLRVRIRQLRSFISFVHPLLEEEKYQNVQNELRSMAQIFAAHREFDVLIEKCDTVLRMNAELQSEETVFQDCLKKELEAEHTKVLQYIESGEANFRLEQVKNNIDNAWKENPEFDFLKYSSKRMKKWTNLMNELIEELSFENFQEIHRIRILNKKLRYVQKDLQPYMKIKKKISQKKLEKLQDHLGEICDAGFHRPVLQELRKKYSDPIVQFKCGILEGYELSKAEESKKESDRILKKFND